MSERSVRDLVDELTLEETVALTHGASDPSDRATGYVRGIERLDVPPLRMVDGPLGVRVPGEEATAFPAPLALAATFDTDLAETHGAALGRETNGMDADALLGPGTNLIRVPQNGRNFEYFSEDPVHSAAFAAAVTRGIESEDVVATPKHYVANSQERYRASVSADVSERALRELYLPSFRAAVDAGAGSVMTAYNGVNGTRMSDHARLLRNVLKGEWGFEGYVVSDWFGTEDAAAAANGGLDVEMPGVPMGEMLPGDADAEDGPVEMPEELARGMPDAASCERFAEVLAERVRDGTVPDARLDDMAERVLRQLADIGRLDGSRTEGAVDTPEHRRLARRVAERATVLLKNDGVLPLADDAAVALVGPNVDAAVLGGGGSSETTPVVQSTPADAVTSRADGPVSVAYGLPPVEAVSMFDLLEGADEETADASTRDPEMADALAAAAEADVAVVCVRDTATEAMDRESLRLPGRQDDLVEAVADATDRTVVVVNSSGPVELPWRDDVDAVVENWYPGQAHGDALAAVLYGDADPSGRLPVTFAPESAYPTSGDERRYPGEDGVVHYDEGVFVGYRHLDREGVEPTYPFGHGESYADYEYVDADLADGTVHVTVENASECDGREVVQLYVEPPEDGEVERPPRELAGFASVEVPAGERVEASVDLAEHAFDVYDEGAGWTTPPGEYALVVGRSSRDARLELAATR
ncbi:glycosyl hydrolase [Halarchaeum grantii]|uniref:Glycosyl hydrolase n=1 Tax=Halarchaeum grantii TaxID=1193105 RepID=A0A830F638_9EURY|nr:glycoside hydrolase family 3 C-terminal domain-containing protein [Halarchaeum grantii]GGL22943.1 glycosyl hydrolase [Halarchaeum grantii]